MEGARSLFGLMLTVLLGSLNPVECAGTQCLSNSGHPVDWFIVYKLPVLPTLPDNTFFYMDTATPSWQYQNTRMNQPGHAVYNTLNQIYSLTPRNGLGEVLYVMYNDQATFSIRDKLPSPAHGHTKGVLAFDATSGFWMVHSTPNFPNPRAKRYRWPKNADRNGQTFLCISMATSENLDKIGKQLLYNYPNIYDRATATFFDQTFPNMTAAMNGHHVTSPPWYSEMNLTSLAGTVFHSFAKSGEFGKDLYKAWLAPRFRDTLYVQTWRSGIGCKLCSDCTGQYWVYNVNSVNFSSPDVEFRESKDHSKWAITKHQHQHWTCIGDINRMVSQMSRAGGAVCFQHTGVWSSFYAITATFHECGE